MSQSFLPPSESEEDSGVEEDQEILPIKEESHLQGKSKSGLTHPHRCSDAFGAGNFSTDPHK